MTLQDPPPHSRRAARAGERAAERDWGQDRPDAARPPAGSHAAGPRAVESDAEPLTYVTQQRPKVPSYDGPSFRSRSLTHEHTPQDGERRDADERPAGVPAWAASSAPVGSWADTPTQAIPAQERPSYRSRDYSPEARRAAAPVSFAPPPPAPSPAAPDPTAAPAASVDLDFVTQRPAELRPTNGPRVQLPPAPPQGGPLVTSDSMSHTLTRRELRALREAEEAQARAATAPATGTETVDFLLASGPIELPHLAERSATPTQGAMPPAAVASQVASAGSVAPDFAFGRADESAVAQAPIVAPEPARSQPPRLQDSFELSGENSFEVLFRSQVTPPAPAAPAAQTPADEARLSEPEPEHLPDPFRSKSDHVSFSELLGLPDAEDEAPRPVASRLEPAQPMFGLQPVAADDDDDDDDDDIFGSQPATVQAPVISDVPDTVRGSRPAGHWSAALDLETDTPGGGFRRVVGSSSSTTNALVLPSIPNAGDLSYSLATGEILVTGSIDLPASIGSTGAHPDQLDDVGIDHLLDPRDREVTTDSAPVRAAKAVSSHTSTRTMIQTKKPKGSKLPTVLLVCASVMAVVVVALIVVTAVTGNL